MEMTEARINEVEERPIKLRCPICLLSSQQMEASLEKKKKNERASETFGTITLGLTFVSLG